MGWVLPHPGLHMRVGSGKERCRLLWVLGLELYWNQLRVGQSRAWQALWELVQDLAQRLVYALPSAGIHGLIRPSLLLHPLHPCSVIADTWLQINIP